MKNLKKFKDSYSSKDSKRRIRKTKEKARLTLKKEKKFNSRKMLDELLND